MVVKFLGVAAGKSISKFQGSLKVFRVMSLTEVSVVYNFVVLIPV